MMHREGPDANQNSVPWAKKKILHKEELFAVTSAPTLGLNICWIFLVDCFLSNFFELPIL